MSIESTAESLCTERLGTCSAIELSIVPKEHDIGGMYVRRLLPAVKKRKIGPWIFFDHMGPAEFSPGEGINVRPHPHINLATVTYLFQGEMLHRDSLGNELTIKPGEINLMVAGKGIVHSERQRDEVKAANNMVDGLQLWLALPEADEEIDPEFHHYGSEDIPSLSIDDVAVRVLIGSAYGVSSPVKTFAKTLYIEAKLQKGQSLTLPSGAEEQGLYITHGKLKARESILEAHTMTVFHSNQNIKVQAEEDTHLAIIGGETISHRYMWWNFASSRKERIEQAKLDWESGVFSKIPGDDQEFIPLPEK